MMKPLEWVFLGVASALISGFAPARSPEGAPDSPMVPVSQLGDATVVTPEAASADPSSAEEERLSEGERLDLRLGQIDERFFPRVAELEDGMAAVEQELTRVEGIRARAQEAGQVATDPSPPPSDLDLEIELVRDRLVGEKQDLQAEQTRLNDAWAEQRQAIVNSPAVTDHQ